MSVASCTELANFFSIINDRYSLFSASTYCWKVMMDILDPLDLKVVKRLSETPLSARHDAASALMDGCSHITSAPFQV